MKKNIISFILVGVLFVIMPLLNPATWLRNEVLEDFKQVFKQSIYLDNTQIDSHWYSRQTLFVRSLNRNDFENLEVKVVQLGFEFSHEYQRGNLHIKEYEYTKKYWYMSVLSLDFLEKENGEKEVILYAFPKKYEMVYYFLPFIAWMLLVIRRMRDHKKHKKNF